MKLCKDCRHFKMSETRPAEYSDCLYTFPNTIEPVTGMPKSQPFTKCLVLRQANLEGCCGPDARFFEPKDPIANCVEKAMRDLLADALNLNGNKAATAPADAGVSAPMPRGSLPNSLGSNHE